MQKNKDNTHPWILCIGTPSSISSAVLVCQRKVIIIEIGKTVLGFIATAGNTLHLRTSIQSSCTAAIRISARKAAR